MLSAKLQLQSVQTVGVGYAALADLRSQFQEK
jgi:hypothetical protein